MLLAVMLFASCSDDNDFSISNASPTSPAVEMTSDLTLQLSTDKALYAPGESVTFTVSGSLPSGAIVRYRHGADVVEEQSLTSSQWTWTAPQEDYTGYLIDIYTKDGDSETIHGTIAVDVSSDWARYPRYGFVATYDNSKTATVIAQEMANLNRYHINGIQFYDWHYAHHQPYTSDSVYTDIANREVYADVIRQYISAQHAYGMKSMFYNLCYGALDNADEDGVKDQWYLYKDQDHSEKDYIDLSSDWKSDIFLTDPSNTEWQEYLANQNEAVYENFDFDGYHIDQVGDRGTVYDYYGSAANLTSGFASFINAMKQAQPDKRLVMNAVANYGQRNIAQTGNVDFLYTELWSGEAQFADLLTILQTNRSFKADMGQVYAAYMNYDCTDRTQFNTPGVLLTDAVMFAIGADHLELGDHMLCHEYFPNSHLAMSDSLKSQLVCYYDFFTAYEDLLRVAGQQDYNDIYTTNSDVTVANWPPRLGSVIAYNKKVDSKLVVNLLNFVNANSLSWRDLDGDMPEPNQISNLTLAVKADNVKRIWVASPDCYGGAPQELEFETNGDRVVFTVPSLKYWSMVVIEQ
jgi:dextranase